MDTLFCCSAIQPYRPQVLAHEPKFRAFMNWAATSPNTSPTNSTLNLDDGSVYVIQLVRQVNFGALESKRYFASSSSSSDFTEITEQDLITANYKKLNAYKNFKCNTHNKFFELNVYEKDPVNKHHWRANIARPATEIDLPSTSANIKTRSAEVDLPTTSANVNTASAEIDRPNTSANVNNAGLAEKPVGQPTSPKEEAQHEDSPPNLEKALNSITISDDDPPENSEVGEELGLDAFDDDDDDDGKFDRYSDGSQSPQDFAACSLEDCGYCGHCQY